MGNMMKKTASNLPGATERHFEKSSETTAGDTDLAGQQQAMPYRHTTGAGRQIPELGTTDVVVRLPRVLAIGLRVHCGRVTGRLVRMGPSLQSPVHRASL